MNIYAYSILCDPRKVDKSGLGDLSPANITGWTTGYKTAGTLRDRCSMIDPVISLAIADAEMNGFNYLYFVEWGRYYFIKEKVIERSGLVTCYCHIDVLYTYHSAISALSAFVERTQSNLKPFITDNKRVLSSETTKTILTPTVPTGVKTLYPGDLTADDANIMLDCVNPAGTAHTATWDPGVLLPYLTKQGAGMATGGVYSSRWATAYNGLKPALQWLVNNPIVSLFGVTTEGIINCIVYPFTLHVASSTLEPLQMLGQNLGSAKGLPLYDNPYEVIQLGTISTSGASGFLDYEPYTKAQLYLPYAGVTEIPMRWLRGNGIKIDYVISIATGEAQIVITSVDTKKYVQTLTAQVGVKIPLASANSLQQAQQYLLGGLKAVASVPAMYVNPVAGGLSMASALTDLAFNPLHMKGQTPDSALARMLAYEPFVVLEQVVDETPTDYGKFVGYPYEQVATLSTLSGFTIIGEVFGHMSFAQEDEQNEILRLLKSGVLL